MFQTVLSFFNFCLKNLVVNILILHICSYSKSKENQDVIKNIKKYLMVFFNKVLDLSFLLYLE